MIEISFDPIAGVPMPYQAFVPTEEGDERCNFLIYPNDDHSLEPHRCERGAEYEIPTWDPSGHSGLFRGNELVKSALTLCEEHLPKGVDYYQRRPRFMARRPLEVRPYGDL